MACERGWEGTSRLTNDHLWSSDEARSEPLERPKTPMPLVFVGSKLGSAIRRAGAGALQRLAAAGGGQRDCGTGDVPTVMPAPRCRTCTGMRNLLAAQNPRSKTGVAENGGG